MNKLGFFFLILNTLVSASSGTTPAMATLIIDSLYIKNFPVPFQAQVSETHFTTTKILSKSEYQLYIHPPSKEFAVEYTQSPGNPKKKIWCRWSPKGAQDIWTLDSLGGRIRKLGNHKKKEPINTKGHNYWLFLPHLLNYGNYTLIEDKTSTTERTVRCETQAPNPYAIVEFKFAAESLRLSQINLYSYNLARSKTIDITFSKKQDFNIKFLKVTDHNTQEFIIQKFQNRKPLQALPQSFIKNFAF